MEKQEKILVLSSGGIDSTTCLAIAIDKVGKENVEALNIIYGQKHDKEVKQAEKIAEYYGINHTTINLSEIMQFSNCPLLKHSTEQIKHQAYAQQLSELGGQGTVDTYVPFRNANMISIAVSWAEVIGAKKIYVGAVEEDSSGYPDCREIFYEKFNDLLSVALAPESDVQIVTPVIHLTKKDIVKKGIELKAPLHLTWSCYQNEDAACGVCESCKLRLKGFELAGEKDPIPYK